MKSTPQSARSEGAVELQAQAQQNECQQGCRRRCPPDNGTTGRVVSGLRGCACSGRLTGLRGGCRRGCGLASVQADRIPSKAIEGLPARLVDVDTANPTFSAGVGVVEPHGVVRVVNRNAKDGDSRVVACVPESRVETIDCRVDVVRGNAGGRKECLYRGVVALGEVENNHVSLVSGNGLRRKYSPCVRGSVASDGDDNIFGESRHEETRKDKESKHHGRSWGEGLGALKLEGTTSESRG